MQSHLKWPYSSWMNNQCWFSSVQILLRGNITLKFEEQNNFQSSCSLFQILAKNYSDVIFHASNHPLSNYISGLNWVDFRHCLIQLELARVIAMARKNHSWNSLCWEIGIIWPKNNYEKVASGIPETVLWVFITDKQYWFSSSV